MAHRNINTKSPVPLDIPSLSKNISKAGLYNRNSGVELPQKQLPHLHRRCHARNDRRDRVSDGRLGRSERDAPFPRIALAQWPEARCRSSWHSGYEADACEEQSEKRTEWGHYQFWVGGHLVAGLVLLIEDVRSIVAKSRRGAGKGMREYRSL